MAALQQNQGAGAHNHKVKEWAGGVMLEMTNGQVAADGKVGWGLANASFSIYV